MILIFLLLYFEFLIILFSEFSQTFYSFFAFHFLYELIKFNIFLVIRNSIQIFYCFVLALKHSEALNFLLFLLISNLSRNLLFGVWKCLLNILLIGLPMFLLIFLELFIYIYNSIV